MKITECYDDEKDLKEAFNFAQKYKGFIKTEIKFFITEGDKKIEVPVEDIINLRKNIEFENVRANYDRFILYHEKQKED